MLRVHDSWQRLAVARALESQDHGSWLRLAAARALESQDHGSWLRLAAARAQGLRVHGSWLRLAEELSVPALKSTPHHPFQNHPRQDHAITDHTQNPWTRCVLDILRASGQNEPEGLLKMTWVTLLLGIKLTRVSVDSIK